MIRFDNFMVKIDFHRTSIHPVDCLCRWTNSSSNHPQIHRRTETYRHIRNWLMHPNPTIYHLPLSIVRPAFLPEFQWNQRPDRALVCLAIPLNVMNNELCVNGVEIKNTNKNCFVLTATDERFDDKNRIIASFISLLIDFCSEP